MSATSLATWCVRLVAGTERILGCRPCSVETEISIPLLRLIAIERSRSVSELGEDDVEGEEESGAETAGGEEETDETEAETGAEMATEEMVTVGVEGKVAWVVDTGHVGSKSSKCFLMFGPSVKMGFGLVAILINGIAGLYNPKQYTFFFFSCSLKEQEEEREVSDESRQDKEKEEEEKR